MTDCTERSEGQEGTPMRHGMTDCTERHQPHRPTALHARARRACP